MRSSSLVLDADLLLPSRPQRGNGCFLGRGGPQYLWGHDLDKSMFSHWHRSQMYREDTLDPESVFFPVASASALLGTYFGFIEGVSVVIALISIGNILWTKRMSPVSSVFQIYREHTLYQENVSISIALRSIGNIIWTNRVSPVASASDPLGTYFRQKKVFPFASAPNVHH